jgi:glycine betaine/proline transport system permease protein
MRDQSKGVTVIATAHIQVDRGTLDASITRFVGPNHGYYIRAFHKIHDATTWVPRTFNPSAALLGPLWSAPRAIWGMFWTFLILELIAWVQIGRGLWGDPGADIAERAARQLERAQEMLTRADAARAAGEDPARFVNLAKNLGQTAELTMAHANAAQAGAFGILTVGLGLLLVCKLVQGFYADQAYERQYSRWRTDPQRVQSGRSLGNTMQGIAFVAAISPLVLYKFTVSGALPYFDVFPEKAVSEFILGQGRGTIFSNLSAWIEEQIDAFARAGGGFFDTITMGVRTVLDALTVVLDGTPWPVVMLVIIVTAWRSAGERVAIFTTAALTYIAFLGYWAVAMETVALVGAAVIICVAIGIPLGIWFGKSRRAYRMAEPILDLMQTLPAFVYLIPIIAFFGTGNPPGIMATIIFGMPPVIRLTCLGMRGVPDSIKEAAQAFGASNWQLLKDVEVPLALPSIMTGVNQTILMCLSMVVIISLIGGGGLGKVILEALQYAAKGPGLLGGFAILLCAMVIDRIVQGAFRREDQKD